MITANSINLKGEAGEKIKLPETIFGIKSSPQILAQAVRVYLGNQREASAKTKTRAEVKKTTAKMFKQKGTGRARHGSYAAPIFVGGGISHGPDGNQNYKRRMPTTMRRLALFAALSGKVKNLTILTGVKNVAKTKDTNKLIGKIREGSERVLVVVGKGQADLRKSVRNRERLTALSVNQLQPYSILTNKKLLITTEALDELTHEYVN